MVLEVFQVSTQHNRTVLMFALRIPSLVLSNSSFVWISSSLGNSCLHICTKSFMFIDDAIQVGTQTLPSLSELCHRMGLVWCSLLYFRVLLPHLRILMSFCVGCCNTDKPRAFIVVHVVTWLNDLQSPNRPAASKVSYCIPSSSREPEVLIMQPTTRRKVWDGSKHLEWTCEISCMQDCDLALRRSSAWWWRLRYSVMSKKVPQGPPIRAVECFLVVREVDVWWRASFKWLFNSDPQFRYMGV